MNFTEPVFAVFLLVVLGVFWALPRARMQHLWLLAASYVFYGWWDVRFLILIVFSSCVDFFVGLGLEASRKQRWRRLLLLTSLVANLGLLAVFKYAGFVTATLRSIGAVFGAQQLIPEIDLLLPVGISFYTFQTLSYSIDVYRREIPATRDPIAFFFFVAAFPQLVAGPIVRAREFLPQLVGDLRARVSTGGALLTVYGLVKKVVSLRQLCVIS